MNNGIDKQKVYGVFQKAADWKGKLYRQAAHKALDIADNEMGIQSSSTNVNGVSWKELAVLGLLGIGSYSAYEYLQRPDTLSPPPVEVATPPVDPSAGLSFYVKRDDGSYQLINIERKPE